MLLALPGGGGGGRLAHDVSDAHVDRLGGGQGHVAGQQRGLLHDGVVVAAVGVRVPPVCQRLGACHGLWDDGRMLDRSVGGHPGQLLPGGREQDLLSATGPCLLCKESWLDLKRLGPRSLSDNGNGILHPNRVPSVLRRRGL